MDKDVTYEEYLKAVEIIDRYNYQIDPTIEVSIEYEAKISVTVRVPIGWNIETIKKELKFGFHDLKMEDDPDIELIKITALIVDGDDIDL